MTRSSRRATPLVTDPRLRPLLQFGGALLKNSHAKTARPISLKRGMHIVLQATDRSGLGVPRNFGKIEGILRRQARLWGVSLRERQIRGSSVHLLLKVRSRRGLSGFLRSVAGMIAMAVTGAAKSRSLESPFWQVRPWSRIVDLPRNYSLRDDVIILRHLTMLGMPQVLESS